MKIIIIISTFAALISATKILESKVEPKPLKSQKTFDKLEAHQQKVEQEVKSHLTIKTQSRVSTKGEVTPVNASLSKESRPEDPYPESLFEGTQLSKKDVVYWLESGPVSSIYYADPQGKIHIISPANVGFEKTKGHLFISSQESIKKVQEKREQLFSSQGKYKRDTQKTTISLSTSDYVLYRFKPVLS